MQPAPREPAPARHLDRWLARWLVPAIGLIGLLATPAHADASATGPPLAWTRGPAGLWPAGEVGLPPYPGATTQAVTRERADGLVRTQARYVATAPLEAVRAFYRDALAAHGWTVVDVEYRAEQWRFFATRSAHEARISLRQQAETVSIELDVTEPAAPTTEAAGLSPHR